MTQGEIKEETEKLFAEIKQVNDRLKELRGICKHPKTHTGQYSYRIGNIQHGIICSDCGELITYH